MDLCALADVKSWLRVKGADDDALLSRLITASSASIENYVNRTFSLETYTEQYDGKGTYKLTLINSPVQSVSQLAIDGHSIPPSTGPVQNGYVSDARSVAVRGYQFRKGFQNISVTYIAGFTTLPEDIRQACIDLVAYRYRGREQIGLSSKAMAGETTSYITGEIPPGIAQTIAQYKKVIPV